MLIVHHLENSRSQRILWLLEELRVDYDIIHYKRDKKTNLAPPELRKVHPLGKSPVIDHDGKVIAETGAMIDYILDHFDDGRFRPQPGTADYERYRYWLHYAEGSAMPLLLMKLLLSRMGDAKMPFYAKPIARKLVGGVSAGYVDPNVDLHFSYIDSELSKRSWFAGENFSGADVIMSFPLEAYSVRGDISSKPNISRFLERIHERPAYKEALERGGPYALLR